MNLKVVGGGIIALTTAICASERGHHVRLDFWRRRESGSPVDCFAHQALNYSTSGAAAAFWTPFAVGEYKRQWAIETLTRLQATPGGRADTGVFPGRLHVLLHDKLEARTQLEGPLWWTRLPNTWASPNGPLLRHLRVPRLIAGEQFDYEIVSEVPIIDVHQYIPFLCRYAEKCGVVFVSYDHPLERSQAMDRLGFDALALCCGGWTPRLVSDLIPDRVIGLTGQLSLASTNDKSLVDGAVYLAHLSDSQRPVYAVSGAKKTDAWLGGTMFTSEFTDPAKAPLRHQEEEVRMHRQANEMLGDVESIGSSSRGFRIGIRPYRNSVRLEILPYGHERDEGPVLVNYGHGGAGYSLSWGCAADAVTQLEAATMNVMTSRDAVLEGLLSPSQHKRAQCAPS